MLTTYDCYDSYSYYCKIILLDYQLTCYKNQLEHIIVGFFATLGGLPARNQLLNQQ